MTVYHHSHVLVWDNMGGIPHLARSQRIYVTDPSTGGSAGLTVSGQPAPFVTTDTAGHAEFDTTIPTARLTGPSGMWMDVTSPDWYANSGGGGSIVDNGDGTLTASPLTVTDHGDGTLGA